MKPIALRPIARRSAVLALGAVMTALSWAQAVPYPNKPVRFIVPFAAGGESDIVARQIAARLGLRGYTVVVENIPGVGGNLGAEKALREAPDGYTLLVISGAYAANAVVSKPDFDPIAAIEPVIQFTRQPSVLLANASYRSLQELLNKARKSPGTVTYGSAGVGSLGHLSTENFAAAAGVKLNHIPYKGNGPAVTDLAGGQIDMMMGGLTAGRALAKAGKVRMLAVASEKRVLELPEVPTLAEAGVVGIEGVLWHGLVASRGVPAAVIAKLNTDIGAALREPEVVSRFATEGLTPVGGAPEQFGQVIRTDMERWQAIAKLIQIRPQ